MLKIKDNVDLKELEKYGFEKDEETSMHLRKFVGEYLIEICIYKYWLGHIHFYKKVKKGCYKGHFWATNTKKRLIKDLIQAGLVEKVEK